MRQLIALFLALFFTSCMPGYYSDRKYSCSDEEGCALGQVCTGVIVSQTPTCPTEEVADVACRELYMSSYVKFCEPEDDDIQCGDDSCNRDDELCIGVKIHDDEGSFDHVEAICHDRLWLDDEPQICSRLDDDCDNSNPCLRVFEVDADDDNAFRCSDDPEEDL